MIRVLFAIALLSSAVRGQEIYDLLLKGGQVIDPANHRTGRFDVAVIGSRIARVAPNLPASHARLVVDAGQYYVTPGLIDMHAHYDAAAGGLNLQADHTALPHGVTTAVDAGSAGLNQFETFKTTVISHAKTRILALLNVDSQTDPVAAAQIIRKYPEILVGVFTSDAVDRAVKAAGLSNTVVMAALGRKAAGDLRPGDIETFMYSQELQPWMQDARRRGVLFDVGHGSTGLWFRIAIPEIYKGFLPDLISTDIDENSILLPRAYMDTTMSKFLTMGMTLDQIVERTTVAPARAIHRRDLGTLSEGAVADVALLEIRHGSFGYLDSGQGKLIGDRSLRCVLTVRGGAVVWDSEGLTALDWIQAGPYTNFR